MSANKSLTPNFEEDIFISYDRDDNKPLLEDYKGWIDTMHVGLARRLTHVMGEEPKIWRDIKKPGNTELREAILYKLENTAFLVFVLSPCYIKSEWCQWELKAFYERAVKKGGIKLGDKLRIFKVVKRPIDDSNPHAEPLEWSELPQELRRSLQESTGYDFYRIDSLTGKLVEFEPELGNDHKVSFLMKLCDLVDDIKGFIVECQRKTAAAPKPGEGRRAPAAPAPARGDCVYLAETTPDLGETRSAIKRELEQNGYHVLPDEGLPAGAAEFAEAVGRHLRRCVLSVNLVGADYTAIPKEENVWEFLDRQHKQAAERVIRQHELAMARGEGDPDFSRLIWMPDGLRAQGDEYQAFISYLLNSPDVYDGGEVRCGVKLEDLKTRIKEKLRWRPAAEAAPAAPRRIYLYCYKNELAAMSPIRQYLAERGYEVMLPFSGGAGFSSGHKENLRLSDAVIIYCSEDTIGYRLDEFRKNEAYRDNRPLLARGIYVSGPETERKQSFNAEDAVVMKNFGDFSPESLGPFLRRLEESAAGACAKGARV
ncbi:MAG TPA: toll/interleukin-1 receptor domain-containing protein [Pyrinomonadaceae bacterium]|nr:toll/interleukin-1 receptor domain-containing protein [Pyrinomonadaceae bacterium]